MWPPPAISVSAEPPTAPVPEVSTSKTKKKPLDPRIGFALITLCALALLCLFFYSPSGLLGHLLVFALSVVIGFYVIGNVSHSLHTPLMSVTNAISGIIVVGSLVGLTLVDVSTGFGTSLNLAIIVLSVSGILLASINVFGGFMVTHRMLKMFQKG
jgi:NAD(P) transhydrogenase subunit alpha